MTDPRETSSGEPTEPGQARRHSGHPGTEPGAAGGTLQSSRRAEPADLARLPTVEELTAAMAHEISQPLAAIAIDGESCLRWLSRDEPRLDEARASVAAMMRNAQRTSDIIRNLLALSTRTTLEREELDLNEVIAEVVSLSERDLLRHHVPVRLDLAGDLPTVLGDRVQLQQVIANLLRNGMQAMEPVSGRAPDLLIGCRQDEAGQILVTVEDNGTGIDSRSFDRLFDAFFTTKADGMGMGLAICRLIVEAHGGRIWASHGAEHGAAFHFALPAYPAAPRR